MSARLCSWLVGVVLWLAFPLPILLIPGANWVPVARYAQLAAVNLGLIASEGAEGMVGLFAGIFVGHVVLYTIGICAFTWLFHRLVLSRLPYRLRDHATVLSLTMLVALAVYKPRFYNTEFHHSDAHASLWELYWPAPPE